MTPFIIFDDAPFVEPLRRLVRNGSPPVCAFVADAAAALRAELGSLPKPLRALVAPFSSPIDLVENHLRQPSELITPALHCMAELAAILEYSVPVSHPFSRYF